MESYIENNKYLKNALIEMSILEEKEFDINEEMTNVEKMSVLYNYIKCKKEINIGEQEEDNSFNIYFNEEKEMIHYSLFIKSFIKKLNSYLKKQEYFMVYDAGSCEQDPYSIRVYIMNIRKKN